MRFFAFKYLIFNKIFTMQITQKKLQKPDFGFAARLEKSLDGRSIHSFSVDCGIADSLIRRYIAGETLPRIDTLEKIAAVAGVSSAWLAFGDAHNEQAFSKEKSEFVELPVHDVEVSAGYGRLNDEATIIDTMLFKRAWLAKLRGIASTQSLCLVRVAGFSMIPDLRDGDLVLLDRSQKSVRLAAIYVLQIDGALLIKNCQPLPGGALSVTSSNAEFTPFNLTAQQLASGEAVIEGRALWTFKAL
jgi:phage repressor protein C with HTH and peptisase S24 domain